MAKVAQEIEVKGPSRDRLTARIHERDERTDRIAALKKLLQTEIDKQRHLFGRIDGMIEMQVEGADLVFTDEMEWEFDDETGILKVMIEQKTKQAS